MTTVEWKQSTEGCVGENECGYSEGLQKLMLMNNKKSNYSKTRNSYHNGHYVRWENNNERKIRQNLKSTHKRPFDLALSTLLLLIVTNTSFIQRYVNDFVDF